MSNLRPKDIKGSTVLDRILKAFLGNNLDRLTKDDKDVLERITEVDNRLRKGYIVKEPRIASLTGQSYEHSYSRPYRKKELAEWQVAQFGISLSQAYIDIQMAERFWLTTESRPDKEFARGMMIHWGEDAMAKAQADGDHRAAAAFYKEVAKIRGLDKHEVEGFNPEDFHPIRPVIVDDPSELGFPMVENSDSVVAKLLKDLKKGVIEKIAEDAEEIEGEGDDVGL